MKKAVLSCLIISGLIFAYLYLQSLEPSSTEGGVVPVAGISERLVNDSYVAGGRPVSDSATQLQSPKDNLTQMSVFAPCKQEAQAGGVMCNDQDPFNDWPIEAIESEAYANPVMAAAAAKYYLREGNRPEALKWAFRSAALDAEKPDALTHMALNGLFTYSSVEIPGQEKKYRVDVLEDRYVTAYVLYHLNRTSADMIKGQELALQSAGYENFSELKERARQTLKEMAQIETEVTGQSRIAQQLAGGDDKEV